MATKTSYIQLPKIRFFKKRKGFAWLLGMYVLVALFILFMLVIEQQKIKYKVERIEDTLTASALSGLIADTKAYSLSNVLIVNDNDTCYETVCENICRNLGLQRVNEHLFNGTDGNYEVTTLIIYNVYDDYIEVVEYANGNKNRQVKETAKTPTDEEITETSIYVELSFPIKACGIIYTDIKKAELVSMSEK